MCVYIFTEQCHKIDFIVAVSSRIILRLKLFCVTVSVLSVYVLMVFRVFQKLFTAIYNY
jgi:hypothetical protein